MSKQAKKEKTKKLKACQKYLGVSYHIFKIWILIR